MRFYDTAKKSLLPFEAPKDVRMYVCGITPYDAAHLGHIFTFMTYDLLQRRLEDAGHTVKLVRNITDVDEPIFKRAAKLGEPYMELAERETGQFHSVMDQLNFRPIAYEPKASEFITDMAEAVQRLLHKDIAYQLENDIYYDISKDMQFGRFCGYSQTIMTKLMHRRGGDPERIGKRNVLDFLLWRGITDSSDTAAWDSPVGHGRPGWHIECSIMSSKLLGLPFDIHGGGDDLIFPHHECEIAQAHGLGYEAVASRWLHVAPLLLYGEKMSKSLGNLIFAKDLLKDYDPSVIRLALMNYQYRLGGEWCPDFLNEAKELYAGIRLRVPLLIKKDLEFLLNSVRDLLDDNLDCRGILNTLQSATTMRINKSGNDDNRALIARLTQLLGIEV